MPAEDFKRQLQEMSAEYRRTLPAKLAQVCALWRGLLDGQAPSQSVAELHRELHTLAGTARTFGIARVSEAAAEAEAFVASYCKMRRALSRTKRAEFERLLDALQRAAQ